MVLLVLLWRYSWCSSINWVERSTKYVLLKYIYIYIYIYIWKWLYLTVKQHLSNTTESNISENNEWNGIMYLCHGLHKLSKHFLPFDVDWLTKSNVMCWNITLASFAFVWFIPFLSKSYKRETVFVQANRTKFHDPLEERPTKSLLMKCTLWRKWQKRRLIAKITKV